MKGLHGIIFAYEKYDKLQELSEIRSAASIPFGGRYRVVDFSLSSFHRVRFDRADMHGCAVENALFDDCSFRGTDFRRPARPGRPRCEWFEAQRSLP